MIDGPLRQHHLLRNHRGFHLAGASQAHQKEMMGYHRSNVIWAHMPVTRYACVKMFERKICFLRDLGQGSEDRLLALSQLTRKIEAMVSNGDLTNRRQIPPGYRVWRARDKSLILLSRGPYPGASLPSPLALGSVRVWKSSAEYFMSSSRSTHARKAGARLVRPTNRVSESVCPIRNLREQELLCQPG